LLTSGDPIAAEIAAANVWECPNLIRFGDRWVLILSLLNHIGDASTFDGVRYLVGDVSVGPDGPRFAPDSGGFVDRGAGFYAPQVLCRTGRTLMWAWSPEQGRTVDGIADAGWAGALTFCRELTLAGDALVSRPVAELDALRREPLAVTCGTEFSAAAFDVELGAGAGPASLWLVDGGAERPVAEFDLATDPVVPPRILVDGSLVEIFDGGPAPYTTRAYPTATSGWILRLASAAPVTAWRLGLPG
jgi:beta-fructofuranosidase